MSHLGQRVSALIDDELDPAERDRVLMHLARCDSCRAETVALRMLKRRMSALGGDTAAGGELNRRLMGLPLAGEQLRPEAPRAGRPRTAGPRPAGAAPASRSGASRPGRYAGAGAAAVLLAGLSTAAFMAGGNEQVPAPKVTPAVDSYFLQHELVTGNRPAARPGTAPPSQPPLLPARTVPARTPPRRAAAPQGRPVRRRAVPAAPLPPGRALYGAPWYLGANAALRSP